MNETTNGKLYKATIYFTDANGIYNSDNCDWWIEFENIMSGYDVSVDVFEKESAPIKWHDDIDINNINATEADFEKYFKVTELTVEEIEKRLGYRVKVINDGTNKK